MTPAESRQISLNSAIFQVLRDGMATYVVTNAIHMDTPLRPTTAQVRLALRRLEKAGFVRLARTDYLTFLCWERTDKAKVAIFHEDGMPG